MSLYGANIPSQSGYEIPQLWAQSVVPLFYPNLVMRDHCNYTHEAAIKKMGDQITITKDVPTQVNPYVMGVPDALQYKVPDKVTLAINLGLATGFVDQDLEAVRRIVKDWRGRNQQDAAKQIQIGVDNQFLSSAVALASAYNSGATAGFKSGNINLGTSTGSPRTVGGTVDSSGLFTDVFSLLADMQQCLDELNVPQEGRAVTLPVVVNNRLERSPIQAAYFLGDQGNELYRYGKTPKKIAGFKVNFSTLVNSFTDTNGTLCYDVLFTQEMGITAATQWEQGSVEKIQFQAAWALINRIVYGYKDQKSDAIGHAVITVPAA
jgi:hypothetical protein